LLVSYDVTRGQTSGHAIPSVAYCIYLSIRFRFITHFVLHDIELSLRQIEAQNSISLSRTLGTPNIFSKGALEQRAVSIPSTLFPPGRHHGTFLDKYPAKKLVEEVVNSPATASKANNLSSPDHGHPRDSVTPHSNSIPETPSWIWRQEGGEIHITIRVPKLVGA
jgi:hypothetical protein